MSEHCPMCGRFMKYDESNYYWICSNCGIIEEERLVDKYIDGIITLGIMTSLLVRNKTSEGETITMGDNIHAG